MQAIINYQPTNKQTDQPLPPPPSCKKHTTIHSFIDLLTAIGLRKWSHTQLSHGKTTRSDFKLRENSYVDIETEQKPTPQTAEGWTKEIFNFKKQKVLHSSIHLKNVREH